MNDLVSRTLGHYRVIDKLGEGGMGEVYRARDERLDRDVAIKVLPREVAQDPGRLARFEREAKLLAALNYQNIATVFGLETAVIPAETEGKQPVVPRSTDGGQSVIPTEPSDDPSPVIPRSAEDHPSVIPRSAEDHPSVIPRSAEGATRNLGVGCSPMRSTPRPDQSR